jgi:hypothetical protein
MRPRSTTGFRPDFEPFESKQLLSAGPLAAHARIAGLGGARAATSLHPAETSRPPAGPRPHPARFTLSRITQTSDGNAVHLVPPFQQVLVQSTPPVPGRTYNVFSVAVRNHTRRTFTASDHLLVRLSGQSHPTPILTGDEQWRPGQFIVFYVLTHKYYPVRPAVSAGFEFDLDGSRGVAIPGPSGIFLRLTYRPATFARTLDWIIAYGPGAEGGKGPGYGLPDTQIWQFQ